MQRSSIMQNIDANKGMWTDVGIWMAMNKQLPVAYQKSWKKVCHSCEKKQPNTV